MTRVACLAGVAMLMLGASSCASAPEPRGPAVDYRRIDTQKQEIRELWMQIRDWRVQALHMQAEPPSAMKMETLRRPLASIRRVCEQPAAPLPACDEVCALAEAICDNAEQICRIARELDGDAWAQGKCTSAKASCKEAKERCCDCHNEPTTDDPPLTPVDPAGPDAGPAVEPSP